MSQAAAGPMGPMQTPYQMFPDCKQPNDEDKGKFILRSMSSYLTRVDCIIGISKILFYLQIFNKYLIIFAQQLFETTFE